MSAALDRIKRDIQNLAPEELEELLRDLQSMYRMPSLDLEDAAAIEAEWEAEIDRRVKEVEDGTVQLISAEEFERHTDALFAKLGLQRPAHAH